MAATLVAKSSENHRTSALPCDTLPELLVCPLPLPGPFEDCYAPISAAADDNPSSSVTSSQPGIASTQVDVHVHDAPLDIPHPYASIDGLSVALLPDADVESGYQLEVSPFTRRCSSVYRCLLKACYAAVFSGLAFGLLSALVDIVLRTVLRMNGRKEMSTALSLLYSFLGGFIPGLLYFPAVHIVQPLLSHVFALAGRFSAFIQVEPGYRPLFWSEDLPEVGGFVFSAVTAELIQPGFSLTKGFCRSALGTAVSSILGEIYRFHSRSYREDKSAEIFSSSSPKLDEVCSSEQWHRNYSMGLALGMSGLISLASSTLIRFVLGSGAWLDAVGQGVNFFWIMTAYELAKRFPGEPTKGMLLRSLTKNLYLSRRHLNVLPSTFNDIVPIQHNGATSASTLLTTNLIDFEKESLLASDIPVFNSFEEVYSAKAPVDLSWSKVSVNYLSCY